MVAPLLTGAGVKGKVNQAMKYGVPVVLTRVAAEGMHTHDGVDCLLADSAAVSTPLTPQPNTPKPGLRP